MEEDLLPSLEVAKAFWMRQFSAKEGCAKLDFAIRAASREQVFLSSVSPIRQDRLSSTGKSY